VQPNENEEKDEKTDEKKIVELTSDELMKEDEDENKENQKPKTEHDLEIEKRLDLLKEALHVKAVENDEKSDLKSIFLDGELPHDPSILVSATETETKTERISKYTDEIADDEAVVLSGKMTISFLSLANHHDQDNEDEKPKIESTTEA
jgi:phosphopantetheine adenylyltransferase